MRPQEKNSRCRVAETMGGSLRAAPRWRGAQAIFTVSMSTGELHGDGFDKKAQHGLMCLFQSYCQCKQPAVQTHDEG